MTDHEVCPECDSTDTDVVNTTVFNKAIERVRVCNDCPTQWSTEWIDPIVTDVTTER